MPFYCDLFDLTVKSNGSKNIPPELIPYTQALYYDQTGQKAGQQDGKSASLSKDFGKQDYELLFLAPWDAKPSNRQANMTLEWGGNQIKENLQYMNIGGLAGRQISTDFERAESLYKRAIQCIDSASKGGQKDSVDLIRQLSEGQTLLNEAARVLGYTLPDDLRRKINNTYNAIRNQKTDAASWITGFSGEINNWFLGKKKQVEQQKSQQKSNLNTTTGDGAGTQLIAKSDHAPIQLQHSTDDFKVTLNEASASVSEDGAHSGTVYTISKSIVCKSSATKSAYFCLVELANYLGIVAPRFSYVGPKTGEWSPLGVSINPPNNFRVDTATGRADTAGVSIIGKDSNSYNFDLFKYRGEFQLRQGYNIYRNLVPKQVTVTASSDMVLLDDNPFIYYVSLDPNKMSDDEKKLFSEDPDKARVAQSRKQYSSIMSQNSFSSASNKVAEEIFLAWKAADLCKKITLYEGKVGYLFPQWLTLTVDLIQIEPYDGVKATQQLFCYADTFIKTGAN